MHILIPNKWVDILDMRRSKGGFQKTLIWHSKAKFEFEWKESWDHEDMCHIS